MSKYIRLDETDNVVVALDDFDAGAFIEIDGFPLVLPGSIARGHKIALQLIPSGSPIVKYAYPIGHATRDIFPGEHVHSHNMATNLEGVLEYSYSPEFKDVELDNMQLTFQGYRRKSGEVGIRNEIWIVPTVGCVNGVGEKMIQAFRAQHPELKVDALEIFKHNYGCSQLGDDHENTKAILRNIVLHPNTGGVLVLSLGCENNQQDEFREFLGEYDRDRVKFLITQKVKNEHLDGLALLQELYDLASNDQRQEVPISELKIGLKCGGSDGLSGITANPLLGRFSDFLISQGGSTVLTEVPEMFGAETILMNRAETKETFGQIVSMINDFKNYFISNGQPVGENPSPGNKEGGITTLEEKSLGCTQKCGKARVKDVLKYGERIQTKGLNVLSAPGNDLVASTALGAAGCQMVLFTTGRGTPFGSFVPTVKISTNNELFENKAHWIDFNAGEIVTGKSMDELLSEFVQYLIEVASGKLVLNEINNYREIAIFKNGVTL